jgi:hypothetical protein
LIHQIRKYAIHKLSTDFVLSPIEKIHLARVHKVAAWLDEGVTSLVSGISKPTLHDLAPLGWETAAQILWIRDNIPGNSNTLHFRRDGIKCGYCSSSTSLINFDYNCSSCRQLVPADAAMTIPGLGAISDPKVQFRVILCSYLNCRGIVFYSISVSCSSCSVVHGPNHNIRITPMKEMKTLIEETFGEEIRNYEVA